MEHIERLYRRKVWPALVTSPGPAPLLDDPSAVNSTSSTRLSLYIQPREPADPYPYLYPRASTGDRNICDRVAVMKYRLGKN